jgi:hypothetical protein
MGKKINLGGDWQTCGFEIAVVVLPGAAVALWLAWRAVEVIA